MTVGQRIGELRKGQKIRQKRIAELLDVSVSTVSNSMNRVSICRIMTG